MSANGHVRLRFGDFEFDPEAGKLFRDGQLVRIQPQPLRVLHLLVKRPGETISREDLRSHIWNGATFVEFDQGLNYCIRHIRQALSDNAADPIYIETLPKQGYRFIADVVQPANADKAEPVAAPILTHLAASPLPWTARKPSVWLVAMAFCALVAIAAAVYLSRRAPPAALKYAQLTDFTDSATAPTLSPDSRMVAFFRGSSSFLTADQIYIKVLPNGEAKRLTDDPRLKYNPAFSPDGSQIAYTVLDPPNWATYTVSIFGGDSHLFLNNAAGLTWLDQNQLLFSATRSGLHMGIVTGPPARQNFRELYFPAHERGMAHYSYASPDRKLALVVEMNSAGDWGPCRIISLQSRFPVRPIGPQGACTSAGWSPDGSQMYFTAYVNGRSHLWRQHFPNGQPEQITLGPTEEEGVAVERDGRSVITSMGVHESAIWIHNAGGDRPLSSEGEIINYGSPPSFSANSKAIYYLLQHQSQSNSGPELWRMMVDSGKSEAVFPGTSMLSYDVSPDGKQVVYSASAPGGKSELWLAPIDGSRVAKRIGHSGEISPHFGPQGQILFLRAEGNSNYLERTNPDGSGRSKVVQYPIDDFQGISPGRRWVMAIALFPDFNRVAVMAIPVGGGPPRIVCASDCTPTWSPSGKWLFIPVEAPTRTSPGRSLALPVGPGETLPELPPGGIKPFAEAAVVSGAQSVNRADLVPGIDPFHFAYVNTTVHRNLYRILLP
ncbi:MAG TPA: winged helix-turn-helix domain-containing protein [Bryobacteraceae bacterium]|jgi:DNA-binding winged helix-turn-helix (wHTH) protein/Tol biopolymer transport system component